MSTFQQGAAGVGKVAFDAWRGIKGLLGVPGAADDIAESRRLDAPLMSTGAGIAGNIAGNVAMALLPGGIVKGAGAIAGASRLPAVAGALNAAGNAIMAPNSIKGAAALGAGLGAVQPAVDSGERLRNILMGAGGGAAGQALFKGAARLVQPNTSPAVQTLMAEGVTPTPGQILGGGWNRMEEGLSSVPIIGDFIKSARGRAVGDLNTAAFNRALAPVGETMPAGMVGRDAIDHVQSTLGAKYDALLPKLTTQADAPFISDISNLQNMMANGSIDPAKASQFNSLLQNQVLSKFQPGANGAPTITGETMKGIDSDLRQLAQKFK